MAWSDEDWLIIDSVLNSIAKSLRRIEQEERKLAKRGMVETANQALSVSAAPPHVSVAATEGEAA